MKKILALSLTFALSVALLCGVLTYAWLGDNGMTSEVGVTSYVHKSYFESGDGTSATQYAGSDLTNDTGCAYEIKYPVQLYYLAWLQELGYFNLPKKLTDESIPTIPTTYFYLSADLDMTGYTLPPIGTQQYPFTGNFDGNGHTISNLTVKNDNSKLTDSPETTLNNAEIIGVFGVVGALSADGKVKGSKVSGDLFASDGSTYKYDPAVNEVKNVTISNPTITTSTNQSLMGIVAGYVNGKISGVRVSDQASINRSGAVTALTYTANLSDYTLMGYVTKDYTEKNDAVVVKIAAPTAGSSQYSYANQGASAGWGGSIDMKSMYNRLNNVLSIRNLPTTTEYVSSETRRYDSSGNLISTTNQQRTTVTERTRYYQAANDGSGSYYWHYRDALSSAPYNYLSALYKTVTIIRETGQIEQAFTIQSGANYLNLNAAHNGIERGTSQASATKWVIDSGKIRTQADDGNDYYLNANGTAFTIGTSGTTNWTKETDAISCTNGYIQYQSGNWVLQKDVSQSGYVISSGENYLNATSTTGVGTGTSASDYNDNGHTLWTVTGNLSNKGTIQLSTIIDGRTYYLYINNSNSNTFSTSTQNTWTVAASGTNYTIRYNNSRYLRYNRGWTNSTNNSTVLTFTQKTVTQTHEAISFADTPVNRFTVEVKEEPSVFTCIPLNADETSPFKVANGNTGYIISGGHNQSSYKPSTWSTREVTVYADIRISQYTKSNISSALSGATANGIIKDNQVKTVKNGTITTGINPNDYQKYKDAVKQFNEQILSGTTNVYGLHFMNATINMENLVVAPSVTIEGQTYTNYEMPEDCIDFMVHQKGYVNFFAGTYFSGNNSFFSLHVIERDENQKITAIKEIQKIYKSSVASDPYLYQYKKNMGWSDPSVNSPPSGYTLVFDTDWITKPGTSNQLGTTNVFYFEVPVNAGEYALGSTDGTGAYLLYLDIAANAQLVNRETVVENFEETVYTYNVPTGATFAQTGTNTLPYPAALGNMTTTGATSVSVTNIQDKSLTESGMDGISYVANGVTVNGSITVGSPPKSVTPVVTKIRRTTYYDYNVANDSYTITEVTAKQVDSGAVTYTINAWHATYSNGTWTKGEQFATNAEKSDFAISPNKDPNTNLDYYLFNATTNEGDTLRAEADAFDDSKVAGVTTAKNSFSYQIPDNSKTEIVYTHTCTIAERFNSATGTSDLYTYTEGTYSVEVKTTTQVVISTPTGSGCTVTNTIKS